jgi:hypothetical protein
LFHTREVICKDVGVLPSPISQQLEEMGLVVIQCLQQSVVYIDRVIALLLLLLFFGKKKIRRSC